MAGYDHMPFPNAYGLPGTYKGVSMSHPPYVDGYREDDPGMTMLPAAKQQLEAGYTGGARMTFGGATGTPVAVIDCVKDPSADFIYMSLVSRYDPSFDDDDFVMVVLRPGGPGMPSTNDRRIDVQPVVTGGGAATSPVDAFDYQVGSGLTPEIRTNKAPHLINCYSRTPGGTPHVWQSLSTPSNLQVAVRSVLTATHNWTVELKIPTTIAQGGASWVDLGSTFGLYVLIGQVYTAAFEDVIQFAWPFDPSHPTASFLLDPFGSGLKTDWDPPAFGTATLGGTADGVTFDGGYNGIGVLDGGGNVGSLLDMTLGATNRFVAKLVNTSASQTAPKIQARFRIAEFGLSGGTWDAAWKNVPSTAPSVNPAPTGGVDIGPLVHTTIETDWTISAADRTTFGPLNRDQCVWVELDTVSTTGGAQIVDESIYHNLTVKNLSTLSLKAVFDPRHIVKSLVKPGKQELLLQVASTPVTVTSDLHTPLERYLSEVGHPLTPAVVNVRTGVGAAPIMTKPSLIGRVLGRTGSPLAPIAIAPIIAKTPIEATKIPYVQENPIISGKVALNPVVKGGTTYQPAQVATWFTTVHGYQRIGKTLTFNGKKRNVLAYAGSYGILARHVLAPGETADKLTLSHTLAPVAGLKSLGKNMYLLDIPAKEQLHVVSNLKTQPLRTLPKIIAKPVATITNLVRKQPS